MPRIEPKFGLLTAKRLGRTTYFSGLRVVTEIVTGSAELANFAGSITS
jgi:hypothetical protein